MMLSGVLRQLVDDDLISADKANEAQTGARKTRTPLVRYLIEEKIIGSGKLAVASSNAFGMPLVDLAAIDMSQIPTDMPVKLVERHQALPLYKRGSRLFIAVSDPTNLQAVDDFQFSTKLNVEAVLADFTQLAKTVEAYLSSSETGGPNLLDDLDDDLENLDVEGGEPKDDADDQTSAADEAPIVKFINKILVDAIRGGASDIHFEPYEKSYRVRFRTDGVLKEINRPPVNLSGRISARLKVMSGMDISERRVPQDGRIKLKLSKKQAIDFRVNTLPTLWGEKIVLRILDPSSAQMGIDALGYEDDQKELYMQALEEPQGMILVTGPTGSGKTVSLYTGLNILNTPERNISTAEDPVEINLEGINQVNMNARVGLTFSEALRSFLRQDPDIVMVGEIRDLETAEIAIKAAQTGHLVLSTLHTNSAPETLTRLANMGVPQFNIATSVSLIIAQRLARRLCPNCKEPATDIPDNIYKDEGLLDVGFERDEITLYKPVGCDSCTKGYKGRVGVYEVVRNTPEIQHIIMNNGNALEIAAKCQELGFNTLRQSALRKAAMGLTSLEEVNRVTKD